jgi:glycosyltransferase involved in cell wall biosynthesis
MPKVSVVIVTYNHEEYISQAIECVLKQDTRYSYEIVVGEDCSSDNTRQIVLGMQALFPSKIRVIMSDTNVGVAENLNRTILSCDSEYIMLIPGDDYLHAQKAIDKLIAFMDSNLEYGLAFAEYNILYEDGRLEKSHIKHSDINIPEPIKFEDMIIKNYVDGIPICIRRDLLITYYDHQIVKKKGFISEDYPTWIELSRHTSIYFYRSEPLATYRVLSTSISHQKDKQYQLEYFKSNYNVKFYYIEKYGVSKRIVNMIYKGYYLGLLKHAMNMHDSYAGKNAYRNLIDYRLTKKEKTVARLMCWSSNNYFNYFVIKIVLKYFR